jgi:hypothetical protein
VDTNTHATAYTTRMTKRNVDDFLSRVDEIMKKYGAEMDKDAEIMKKYRAEMDKDAEEEKVEKEKAEKEKEKDDKEVKRLNEELGHALLRISELEKEKEEKQDEDDKDDDDDEEEEKDEDEKGGDSSTPKTICYSP